MRKVLLSAVALTGLAVTASVAGSAPAAAQPYGYGYGYGGIVEPAQYQDWRWRERRHEEWRRHERYREWRHERWAAEHRGW